MIVTPTLTEKLTSWLGRYWKTYLEGDLDTWSSLVKEDYYNIDGTKERIWRSKREILENTHSRRGQMPGRAELRHRTVKANVYGELVMVNESADMYGYVNGEWTFCGPFHMSSLMEKTETDWIVKQQHGSFPDKRAMEGETLYKDPLKAENARLLKTLKQRTAELKQKNRELEIEAAVERVRARTMAMLHSEELGEVSFLLDREVRSLGIKTWGCAFNIFQEKDSLEWFSTENGVMPTFTIPRESFFLDFYETCKSGETFFIKEWVGEECTAHYEYLAGIPSVGVGLRELKAKGISFPTYQLDHVAAFKYGYLLFITYEAVPESHDIFKRFARVFEQTYTRFLDLQKAELQAREAQIELSLERIRAQVMAMRASTDLLDIVVLMRHEFISLGHTAYYFWHMRWLPDGYQKAMTSAYGNKIGMVMDLPLGFHGDQRTLDWEVSTEPIGIFPYAEEAAVDYINNMIRAGRFDQIDPDSPKPEQLRADGGLTIIMARTTHGEIGYSLPGVVNEPPQADLNVLIRFAGVFDLAYTRFEDLLTAEANTRRAEEDLIQLKKAKAQAENALTELKAIQDQLVQQEKLASLGQLTAGIAHEIKNPLNFVNNFSELSQELLEEAFSELEQVEPSSHREEVEALLRDVQSNLSKVHEHGTRANSIVTSMLQHSRASIGKSEQRDLNLFVKEIVNLSFHGMRAGKSPINVDIAFQFDPEVGEVPLISEDFSRVILNLCNNSFDAMREKSIKVERRRQETIKGKENKVNYTPSLTVRTVLKGDRVILSVEDNGSGIPDSIRDKILQPFFTTKKGTEGTGLGLSITHDIIKAHHGSLEVSSTVGEGTTFRITIPNSLD